jgi:peptidoglycan/LPS O-acetylase OafA/YrhL
MSRRLHYIDWLRVGAVLLLFPFHTWRVFNAGDPFYVKAPYQSQAINAVIWFIDFWHMPLLFLLAGASTYFALRKRTGLQYLGERFTRIFVPLVAGWFLLIPPQTWYGARFNSGYTGSFFHYLVSGDWVVWNVQSGGDYYGGFGMGQLWFLLYLFFIAIMALPLLLLWRSSRGEKAAGGLARFIARPWAWIVVAFVLMIAEGLPSPIDGKSYFYFLALFILGYAIMADDAVLASADRYRWPALIVGVTIILLRMIYGGLHDSLPDPSWQLALFNTGVMLAVWLVILGLLGTGRRYLDKPSKQLAYLAEASYPLYILHQTVIVVLAFYLINLPGPWFLQWVVLLIAVVAGTFGLYEVVRRLGPLRFLLGLKVASPTRAQAAAEPETSS